MPEKHSYYQGFINALQQKIPQRASLVNTIADLLIIDKDAVYRRLRGEVNFSFIEMASIAIKLGISLDNIVGIATMEQKPVLITLAKHINPADADYRTFGNYIYLLNSVKDKPDSLLLESGNVLPHNIFYDYEYFTRLNMFCWHLGNNDGTDTPYHQVTIPEPMREMQKQVSELIRHIKTARYVWDRMIFQRIVNNVKVFSQLRLIKEEDVLLIRNELLEIVDNIEKLAIRGRYEDTGNEVFIYISDILFETSYSTLKSQNTFLSQFKTFLLNANSSLDEDVYHSVSNWILALQRKATLISISGEKARTDFFNTQRKILNTL